MLLMADEVMMVRIKKVLLLFRRDWLLLKFQIMLGQLRVLLLAKSMY